MQPMKIAKWGNSLAVRLPADLVRDLDLKVGDYVERDVLALRKSIATLTREEALARMAATKWKLPKGYKFDREEANSRS